MTFTDGYGNSLDRTNVCYDPSASVVVRVVDTCPCNYPNNFYSNKRWCCGDMDHLDLSIWAFEKVNVSVIVGFVIDEDVCSWQI